MDFIEACREMRDAVQDAVSGLVGTPEGGEFVCMGADGTPTKRIDQAAEDIVREYLTREGICATLVSEECGKVDGGGRRGTVFLDPVDGTYNAVAGIPFYALSLAYAEGGNILYGFVSNLANNETFEAEKGAGSTCNGRKITVSRTANLDESAMSIYGRKFDLARMTQIGQKIRRFRLLGASALELCYLASGRVDGFIDLRGTLRVTDAAAGMLICSEAGGRVSDIEGKNITFPDEVTVGRCLIATNRILHSKVIEYLR